MNKEEYETFFKEHFKEIKNLADKNNKITLATLVILNESKYKKKIGDKNVG
jgi:hypothetical protein